MPTTNTAPTALPVSVPTPELQVGDVVLDYGYGMRLEVVEPVTPTLDDPDTVWTRARCLNVEDFAPGGPKADRFVYQWLTLQPTDAWPNDLPGTWMIQGNRFATWRVIERRG